MSVYISPDTLSVDLGFIQASVQAVHPFNFASQCAMVANFNPRVPKSGVRRAIQKRPASKKNQAWNRTAYVLDPDALPAIRGDRDKWTRSLADILKSTPSSLVTMLRADGLFVCVGRMSLSSLWLWHFGQGSASIPWWLAKAQMQRQGLPTLLQSTPWSPPFCRRYGQCSHSSGNPSSIAPTPAQPCSTCCSSSPSASEP